MSPNASVSCNRLGKPVGFCVKGTWMCDAHAPECPEEAPNADGYRGCVVYGCRLDVMPNCDVCPAGHQQSRAALTPKRDLLRARRYLLLNGTDATDERVLAHLIRDVREESQKATPSSSLAPKMFTLFEVQESAKKLRRETIKECVAKLNAHADHLGEPLDPEPRDGFVFRKAAAWLAAALKGGAT